MEKTVTLVKLKTENISLSITATLLPDGSVRIDGHDLSKDLSMIFGQGISEYEYSITIENAEVPFLLVSLNETGDVLSALQAYFRENPTTAPRSVMDQSNIAYKFWSRLGD